MSQRQAKPQSFPGAELQPKLNVPAASQASILPWAELQPKLNSVGVSQREAKPHSFPNLGSEPQPKLNSVVALFNTTIPFILLNTTKRRMLYLADASVAFKDVFENTIKALLSTLLSNSQSLTQINISSANILDTSPQVFNLVFKIILEIQLIIVYLLRFSGMKPRLQ